MSATNSPQNKRTPEDVSLFDKARAVEQNAKPISIRDFINLASIDGKETPIQQAIHDTVLSSKAIKGGKMPKAVYITNEIIEGCGYVGDLAKQKGMFVGRLMKATAELPVPSYWKFDEADIIECRKKFRELDGKDAAKLIKKDVIGEHYIVTNEVFKTVVLMLTTEASKAVRKYLKTIEQTIDHCIEIYPEYVQYSKNIASAKAIPVEPKSAKAIPVEPKSAKAIPVEPKSAKPKIKVVGTPQKMSEKEILLDELNNVIVGLTALKVADEPSKTKTGKEAEKLGRAIRIYRSTSGEYKATEGNLSSLNQKSKEMEKFGYLVCDNLIASGKDDKGEPVFNQLKKLIGDRGEFKGKTFTAKDPELTDQSIKDMLKQLCACNTN
jgi:hypothetical protein